ncbi:MAG: hypothetical protein ACKPKO_15130, partial [Candidatus Fonsibacter sp.]
HQQHHHYHHILLLLMHHNNNNNQPYFQNHCTCTPPGNDANSCTCTLNIDKTKTPAERGID